jgi:superfamily II DNA helicase RecQ
MFGDSFHLIRRSNERINMQLIVDPLKRTKGVSKFAKILEYLRSGRKTVIHVNTIPDAYDIYEFLWHHVPAGTSPLRRMRMYHSLCTDDYNQQTFELIDNDSDLQVVIATIAFTQGINCKLLLDSISFGFPSTLDDYIQAKGRVGRSPDVICRGIAIVSERLIANAKNTMRGDAYIY